MHTEVLDWIGQFRTTVDLAVLDIGGRNLNGSPRMMFPNANPYHVLDLRPGENVQIVADAADWAALAAFIKPGTYDLVICTEVFEHTPNWREIIQTANVVLRPGGWLLFTCAGPGRPPHSGIEAVMGLIGNEYYANVGPQEIAEELADQGWTDIETHLRGTDTQGKAVKPVPPPPVIRIEEALAVLGRDPREVLMSASLSRTAAG